MDKKITILKALAIMLVVSGHLEFSLIPMFPPYSFQLALFFFISGMLFNEKYGVFEYIKRRFKSLMLPYFLYSFVYLGITIAITPLIGKFWGMEINWYNELVIPFLTGHQLDLTSPLWFVPQLFITLIIYKVFRTKTWVYFLLALIAIQLAAFRENLYILLTLRTMFSLFFVHMGYLYSKNKPDIFKPQIIYFVILLQSILWLTNKDFTPADGIGLSYILVWGEFDNPIVPILTSLSGIYISLLIIEIAYEHIKNWSFLEKIGQNTYHIKTTYFYFIAGIIFTTYFGELLKYVKSLSKHT